MKSIQRSLLLLLSSLLCLSLTAQLAPQDNWTHIEPDIDPPSGMSFSGPLAASATEVFVGLDNGEIAVYTAAGGSLLRQIGSFTSLNGLALDSSGKLWVLDLSVPSLTRLDPADGTVLSSFGTAGSGEGEITQQSTNTRSLLDIDGSDRLFVADPLGRRVLVFGPDGSFLHQFGEAGDLIGQFSGDPKALAVAKDGTVYILAGRFYKLTDTGEYVAHRDVYLDNLSLTPEELPILSYWKSSFLYSYDLLRSTDLSIGGSSNGPAFQPNGTLWRIDNGGLQQWRRNYVGADEPAPGVERKVPPQPRILSVAQRPGTTLLDIEYEVIDPDSANVEVRVLAWRDGGTTLQELVLPQSWAEGTSANLGLETPTNSVHRLTWDVGADFSESYGYFEVEILAVDNQPLLPVHWITIPASEEMDSFAISRQPVSEDALLDYLLWEVAAEEGSNYVSGSGIYRKTDGEPLFWQDTLNSWALNDYLNDLGMSWATTEERNRVSEGRFGQQSVSEYTVTRMVRPVGGRSALADEMVLIVGGTLTDASHLEARAITEFELGRFEVTYAHWRKVRDWGLGNGYTDLPEGRLWFELGAPVASVSWYDSAKWCNAKSEMEGLTPVYQVEGSAYKTGEAIPTWDESATGYRLPTQAEWEYAARGGINDDPYPYAGSDEIDDVAWYSSNSSNRAQPVGTKQPNSLGIYDMSGNVSEWCWDAHTYSGRIRGGSWDRVAGNCTVSTGNMSIIGLGGRDYDFGFRLARNSEQTVTSPVPLLGNTEFNGFDNWEIGSNIYIGNTWQAFVTAPDAYPYQERVSPEGDGFAFNSWDDGVSDKIETFLYQEWGAGPDGSPTPSIFESGDIIVFKGTASATTSDPSDVIVRAFIRTLGFVNNMAFQVKNEYTEYFPLTGDLQDFELSITFPDLAVDDSPQVLQVGFEITTSTDGTSMDTGEIFFKDLEGYIQR